MSLHLECECGEQVPVTTRQAGCDLPCSCGRVLTAPSMGDLNRGATQPVAIMQPSEAQANAAERAASSSAPVRSASDCPFCGNRMEDGAILGDRYRLKWMPAGQSMALGIFALGGEPIGENKLLSRPQVEGMRCTACRKMILDY